MSTRLIHPGAAGLSDGIHGEWLIVRKATTGNFTTLATLEAADEALAKLLNSRITDLKRLRAIIQAEAAAIRQANAEAEEARRAAAVANSDPEEPEAVAS